MASPIELTYVVVSYCLLTKEIKVLQEHTAVFTLTAKKLTRAIIIISSKVHLPEQRVYLRIYSSGGKPGSRGCIKTAGFQKYKVRSLNLNLRYF